MSYLNTSLGVSLGSLEALLGLLEVDDRPNVLEVVSLNILVLEVESVLPSVDTDDGVVRDQRVLVLGGDNLKLRVLGVETEPAPTRALDGGNGSVEGGFEVVERAKVTFDGLLEGTILKLSTALAGRSKVLPEERVVNVATAVELDGALELNLLANVVARDGRVVGLDSVVEIGDVKLVVLGVVDGHDLLRDGGLELIVAVRELGKGVLSGSSAGGWQCLMVGLGMCPNTKPEHLGKVKGIAAIYPITTMDHPFFLEKQVPFGGFLKDDPDTFADFRDPDAPVTANTAAVEHRRKFYMHAQQEALFPSLLFSQDQRDQGWLQKTDVVTFLNSSSDQQRKNFPPVYIVHGEKDSAVDVDHARRLEKALKALHIPVIYDEVPGRDHLWDQLEPEENLEALWNFSMEQLRA